MKLETPQSPTHLVRSFPEDSGSPVRPVAFPTIHASYPDLESTIEHLTDVHGLGRVLAGGLESHVAIIRDQAAVVAALEDAS